MDILKIRFTSVFLYSIYNIVVRTIRYLCANKTPAYLKSSKGFCLITTKSWDYVHNLPRSETSFRLIMRWVYKRKQSLLLVIVRPPSPRTTRVR